MGSAAAELALDLRPAVERGVAGLARLAATAGQGRRVAKLEEYIRGLEEERRKIEGFRRELPLCMLILSEVMEGLKEETALSREAEATPGCYPVLEEFLPLKRKSEKDEDMKQEKDKNFCDKVNWMSTAQLWSDNRCSSTNTSSTTSTTVAANNNDASSSNSRDDTRERAEEKEKRFVESMYRNQGGAFLPFKVLSSYPPGSCRKEEKVGSAMAPPLPDLSLFSPGTKASRATPSIAEDQRSGGSSSRCSSRGGVASSAANAQSPQQQPQQPPAPPSQQAPRKPRRCWSPELHRRFVKALQQLGGSQAATPKQIRELMKVDGLTNDEVKSHLQKYRLHTRRGPTASSPANEQLVVLGGMWVPPENYPVPKRRASPSGSPQGPLHLSGASCDEEDGKSESYSWKGHHQISNGEETDCIVGPATASNRTRTTAIVMN